MLKTVLKKGILFGAVTILLLATLITVSASRQDSKETAWRYHRYGRPAIRHFYGPGYYHVPARFYGRPYYRDYYRPYYRPYYYRPGIYVGPGQVHVGPVDVEF